MACLVMKKSVKEFCIFLHAIFLAYCFFFQDCLLYVVVVVVVVAIAVVCMLVYAQNCSQM